jgi:glycosyltransferase involved in cell wall biosynthesis
MAEEGLELMRIAMVACSPYETDPRIRRAAETLTQRGHHVDFLCLTNPGPQVARRAGLLHFYRFPLSRERGRGTRDILKYGIFFLWAFGLLSWLGVRQRYDVIYVHNMPNFLVFAAVIPKISGAKLILDVHDPAPELLAAIRGGRLPTWLRRLIRAEERVSLWFADALVTVSEPMRQRLLAVAPRPLPITVVMNLPDPRIIRSHYEVGEGVHGQRLVYGGTLSHRHGLDLALRAVAILAKEYPDLRLRLIGEGPEVGALVALADDLGIAERVEFMGLVPGDQVPALVRGSVAGLSPHRADDFGSLVFSMKVPEYIALGLPVICAGSRTMRHYFGEDELLFFEPGEANDLARAIRELLDDPASAARRVEHSQQRLKHLNWSAQRDTLIHMVESLARPSWSSVSTRP